MHICLCKSSWLAQSSRGGGENKERGLRETSRKLNIEQERKIRIQEKEEGERDIHRGEEEIMCLAVM